MKKFMTRVNYKKQGEESCLKCAVFLQGTHPHTHRRTHCGRIYKKQIPVIICEGHIGTRRKNGRGTFHHILCILLHFELHII